MRVHANGLVSENKGKAETWLWTDVEEFYVLAEQSELHSAPSGPIDGMITEGALALLMAAMPKDVKYKVYYSLRRGSQRLGRQLEDSGLQAFGRDRRELSDGGSTAIRPCDLP